MSATSPTLTPELYAQEGGLFCPVCESNDLSGGTFETDVHHAWQPIKCLSCGATWNDVYALVSYSKLERPQ